MVDVAVPEVADGEVEVEALILSVDPYMRPRLNADQPLGAPMLGGGIGRVVRSRNPKFKEGDLVRHGAGFQDRFVSDSKGLAVLHPDPALPLSVYMHALGGTGMTAYGGLLEVGALKDGEQVFVSTAGGAVGSVVAQIAKLKGCSRGGFDRRSDGKAAWLRDEAGLDAVINYKTQPLAEALAEGDAEGHRRLFRERRRRPPRRRSAAHERAGPYPGLRHDLDLQRRRRGRARACST